MTRLSNTQRAVLAAAASRKTGSVLPLPATLKGGAAIKVIDALISRGLAERQKGKQFGDAERVRITQAGREAAGAVPMEKGPTETRTRAVGGKTATPCKTAPRGQRGDSKQAQALALLARPQGATVAELEAAFGWQPHTVRGFLSGAVKKRLGLTVKSEKVEDRGRVYRITETG